MDHHGHVPVVEVAVEVTIGAATGTVTFVVALLIVVVSLVVAIDEATTMESKHARSVRMLLQDQARDARRNKQQGRNARASQRLQSAFSQGIRGPRSVLRAEVCVFTSWLQQIVHHH